MGDAKVTRGNGLLEAFLAKKRARMAEKLIPDHLRKGAILDIGCGTTPFFLLNTKFNEKHGIDPEVNETGKTKDNIRLCKLDIEENSNLPFEDDSFEVITMLAVLEHLDRDKLALILSEINRVLKKDGRLILTTPSPKADGLLKMMAKLNLVSKEEMEEHKYAYDHDELKGHLIEAGFKEEHIKTGHFELFLNNWACAHKRV